MHDDHDFPRADVVARFRRPKVLELPENERDALRLRLEWDDPVHVEELLEIEIVLSDDTLRCTGRVARVDPVVWKEPTRYEVYLELFGVDEALRGAIEERVEVREEAAPAVAGGSGRYVMRGPFLEGTSFRRPQRGELFDR